MRAAVLWVWWLTACALFQTPTPKSGEATESGDAHNAVAAGPADKGEGEGEGEGVGEATGAADATSESAAAAVAPTDEPAAAVEEPQAPKSVLPDTLSEEARSAYVQAVDLVAKGADGALGVFAAGAEAGLYAAALNAGVLEDARGNSVQAKAYYERALRENPAFGPAVAGLAQLLHRSGDPAGASALLDRHVAAHPDQAMPRAIRAQLRAQAGDHAGTREDALEALRLDERCAEAMMAMGMMYRRQGKLELASLALGQAIEIEPQSGVAYNELGMALWAQDKKPQAVLAFERAAASLPGVAAVLNNLGVVRTEVGAFRSAVEDLTKATELKPQAAGYYLNLGLALRGDQRYEDAAAAYKKALHVGGGTPLANFNLGVLYLDNDMGEQDAIKRLQTSFDYLKAYEAAVQPVDSDKALVVDYLARAAEEIDKEQKRRERAAKRDARRSKKALEKARQGADAAAKAAAAETETPTEPTAAPAEEAEKEGEPAPSPDAGSESEEGASQ
jgi:Tfp pilus assembly protein PilF